MPSARACRRHCRRSIRDCCGSIRIARLDLRLTKSLQAGAGRRIDLLLEAFNLTNEVNDNPVVVIRNMSSAQFLERGAPAMRGNCSGGQDRVLVSRHAFSRASNMSA